MTGPWALRGKVISLIVYFHMYSYLYRTTEVRRSMIIKDTIEEGGPKSSEPVPTAPANLQQMGPGSTRNLLISFLWVLRNIDPTHLCQWWVTLPISRYVSNWMMCSVADVYKVFE